MNSITEHLRHRFPEGTVYRYDDAFKITMHVTGIGVQELFVTASCIRNTSGVLDEWLRDPPHQYIREWTRDGLVIAIDWITGDHNIPVREVKVRSK